MLFYVALAWNEQDKTKQEAARRLLEIFRARFPLWDTAFEDEGLAVVCRIESGYSRLSQVYPLRGRAGVVLGKLFDRQYEAGVCPTDVTLSDKQSAAIVTSGGKYLVEHYWGQYVAFLRDHHTKRKWVLRDPVGEIECYMTRVQGVHVYFLRLEDCKALGNVQMSVSRRGLIGQTALPFVCNRVTALNEVEALLAGECMEIWGDENKRTFYWNPLQIASSNIIEDVVEAERLTRKTVRACVHAWASCFDVIVHRLSGGLDSSIVLACIKDAPNQPKVICENIYGRTGSQQDERRYARLMAQRAGYELMETQYRGDDYFTIRQAQPLAPEPYHFRPLEGNVARITELMRATALPAIFDGFGGDELFFRHTLVPTAADFCYRHGPSLRAWQIALQDSAVDRASLWRVARATLIHGSIKRRWNCRSIHRSQARRHGYADPLVRPELREEAYADNTLWHPLYLEDIAGVPPGKAYHCLLMSLASETRCYPPLPDRLVLPIEIMPLRSQPLVELSLRIPMYVLRSGGRDRAMARRAFSEDVPHEIIERRSKGGGNETIQAALSRNIASVRDRLMNGRLAELGYLDRSKVGEALSLGQPTTLRSPSTNAHRHFTTEVWLSSWANPIPAAQ